MLWGGKGDHLYQNLIRFNGNVSSFPLNFEERVEGFGSSPQALCDLLPSPLLGPRLPPLENAGEEDGCLDQWFAKWYLYCPI